MVIIAEGTIYRPVTDQEAPRRSCLARADDRRGIPPRRLDRSGREPSVDGDQRPGPGRGAAASRQSPAGAGRLGVLHHHTSRRAPDLLTASDPPSLAVKPSWCCDRDQAGASCRRLVVIAVGSVRNQEALNDIGGTSNEVV
jgi:hypothetical protein